MQSPTLIGWYPLNRNLFSVTLLATVILVLPGCKTPAENNSWLIIIGNDSIRTGELLEAWSELDTMQRDFYLSAEKPSQIFAESYLRKQILLNELDELGYLNEPSTIAFSEAWLRLENAILISRLVQDEIKTSITADDLDRYHSILPAKVWFTAEPGSSSEILYDSIDMRTLPLELYEHLTSLAPGDSGMDMSGTIVRLDSISPFNPSPWTAANADSVDRWNISLERARLFMINALQTANREYSVSVDSASLKMFALQLLDDNQEVFIVYSGFRNWNASEMQYELDFLYTRMPVQNNSFEWLNTFIETMILHSSLLEYAEVFYPEKLDSLQTEKENYFYDLALDHMYKDLISDQIIIESADIEEQYALLEEPFMFEERRVLETAILPANRMSDFEQLTADDAATDMILQLPPLERLSDNALTPGISRPLRLVEVPAELGSNVFQLLPSDTIIWNGPYPIDEADGFIFFRLVEVIPTRMAEMDEITYDLTAMARRRLEHHATEDWILELGEKYGAVVNEEALEQLPADPGQW